MNEPRYTVEAVTQLALFQPGDRFQAIGPRRACRGSDRTAEDARLGADGPNNPPSWPK